MLCKVYGLADHYYLGLKIRFEEMHYSWFIEEVKYL